MILENIQSRRMKDRSVRAHFFTLGDAEKCEKIKEMILRHR